MNSYSVKSQGVNEIQQDLMIGICEQLYLKCEAIPVEEVMVPQISSDSLVSETNG